MSQATQEVQEITPEVQAMINKLKKEQAKKIEKIKENIKAKYPFANPDTLSYDPEAKKYKVEVTCVKCGTKHYRYTQDLHQTKGLCPECQKAAQKKRSKEKAELQKQAMALLAEQQKS